MQFSSWILSAFLFNALTSALPAPRTEPFAHMALTERGQQSDTVVANLPGLRKLTKGPKKETPNKEKLYTQVGFAGWDNW